MVLLVQQVMRQTKARIFAGDTHAEGKIVSLFEPTTEVIRKSLPRRKPGARPASRPNSAKWSMEEISVIGIDLAKRVFQLCATTSVGRDRVGEAAATRGSDQVS